MSKQLLHTPEGVRDIYGSEYEKKTFVEQSLRKTIRSYGYEPIQTPTFEFFDVFSKEIGTTPSKELYKFFDKEGNTLVLRPDFTPSIARCAAKYFMEEQRPIRFTYMGNTFTNTSNLQGKLKEITQMGAELINDSSVEADAEMISLMVETLKATGLQNFIVTVGNAEYFKGMCEEAGLDEETEYELRSCISGKNFFAAEELLNAKNIVVKIVDISKGGMNSAIVEPKEILQEAIKTGVPRIILVHNHPSGDPTPSDADICVTHKIRKAGEMIGIELLDHIIIGNNCYFSMREKELL